MIVMSYERLLDSQINPTVSTIQMGMPRICGPKLANCCFVISIWGIIMLVLLGIFYKVESVALVEDVPIVKGEKDYHGTATNCFIAAGIYAVTLAVSGYQKYAISRGYCRL